MVDVTEHTTPARKRWHGIPLQANALLAVSLVAILPLSFAFFLDSKLSMSAQARDVFIAFLSKEIIVAGFPVHFYLAFVALLFGAGMSLGILYIDRVFIHPLRLFRRWLEQAAASKFETIPVMPHVASYEISRLGTLLASALATLHATRGDNKDLSSKKSELLLITAHQLRTPLTGLKWASQALSGTDVPTEEAAQHIMSIRNTVQRMTAIVDNIVASADIDEGTLGYSFASVDIVPVINKELSDNVLLFKERKLHVTFNHPDTVRPAFADAFRISSVFANLLQNALEYTPEGGTVSITLEDRGPMLECTIADSGIGIPERELPLLFTKFHRGDNARHLRPNGSGLGLYLVKNVIDTHGGAVHITSVEGRGTRATISIPFAPSA